MADDAATRLTERPTPSTYAFEYRAGGTTVLDCVVDNRQFVELPAPDATTRLTNVEPARLAPAPAEPCHLGGT